MKRVKTAFLIVFGLVTGILWSVAVDAMEYGGGYAATGQLAGVNYSCEIYDASNGLPTSDAVYLLCAKDGHMWIGGYSGVIRYDGTVFERLDTSNGLTSARALFEDSQGRLWAGTNDNGVVVIHNQESVHLTYKEGLPASSVRIFAEDGEGNVFIGTTSGVCYVDSTMQIHTFSDETLDKERILKMETDSTGKIYGQTSNGILFSIEHCKISEVYTSDDLRIEKPATFMLDPNNEGMIYLGTDSSTLYYGEFGAVGLRLKRISVAPLEGIHWMSYECGRV
nr:hybrid sensor histidine kinase/response regulator [Acetatifactor sp.]